MGVWSRSNFFRFLLAVLFSFIVVSDGVTCLDGCTERDTRHGQVATASGQCVFCTGGVLDMATGHVRAVATSILLRSCLHPFPYSSPELNPPDQPPRT